MRITSHKHAGDVLVLGVAGGLDAETSGPFVDKLQSYIDSGVTRIVLDCTLLEFVSSYGLGVLIRLHKRMRRRGGQVRLCSIKGVVGDVLEYTRLDRVFEIYPDVESALAAFEPAHGGKHSSDSDARHKQNPSA